MKAVIDVSATGFCCRGSVPGCGEGGAWSQTVRPGCWGRNETGYRWLRQSFLLLREQGLSVEAAQVELGYFSPLAARWDRRYPRGFDRRHHLRVDAQVEEEFWRRFLDGASLEAARRGAGVGRSTAYRWRQARYVNLREDGVSVRLAARQLRVPTERATAWEAERRDAGERARRDRALARPALTCRCATRATGSSRHCHASWTRPTPAPPAACARGWLRC